MKIIALLFLFLFATTGFLGLSGARINITSSYPRGLYWLKDEPAAKGALVLACPPAGEVVWEALRRGYLAPGFCPSGTEPLLKKIVAGTGDQVSISASRTEINGEALADSAQIRADLAGRPLPAYQARLTLAEGQVLLMSDWNPRSFDARYFGPVGADRILGVVRPVWVLGRMPR